MKNVLLTVMYDGTGFSGWQRQPEAPTVQGELERVLSQICGERIQVDGTSRTDAGVHALGQRCSFFGNFGIPVERIALAANNMLSGGMNKKAVAGRIYIKEAISVPEGFHARFNSLGKTYEYRILACSEPDVFSRNYCYQIREELNLNAMKKAAENIVGTHDFACFQAAGGQERKTTVRTIYGLGIEESFDERNRRHLTLRVTGDGFLYNMVRIITGTLVDVGKGKIQPEALADIIESRDRTKAGHTAPPQGLYLKEIYYSSDDMMRAAADLR